jgi:arsenical pump membrane protein
VGSTALILLSRRTNLWPLLRVIHWGVLPLVAGLFVFVEALDRAGVTAQLTGLLQQAPAAWGAAASGAAVAFGSNLVNNLPAGLIAASAVHQAGVTPDVTAAILIGVDLGPNLSVTGSLATILWLAVLRREQQQIRDRDFLLLGLVAMPLALIAALALV